MQYKRIISLLPSATEVLYGLGVEKMLVGRSHECDYPSQVDEIPVCSSATVNNEMSSEAINEKVKESLLNAVSVYQLDIELIKSLKPDIVITQSQCKACAVDVEQVEGELQKALGRKVQIIDLAPSSLEEFYEDIMKISDPIDVFGRGKRYVKALKTRIQHIEAITEKKKNKPVVAAIEWMEPLMVAGHWMPELIEFAGGTPSITEKGKPSQWIQWEDIQSLNPDVLFIANCGFSIKRTMQEIDLLKSKPGWSELKAVKNNQVYAADGNAFFNRSGPRLVESIEILCDILHPENFMFGHLNRNFIRVDVNS